MRRLAVLAAFICTCAVPFASRITEPARAANTPADAELAPADKRFATSAGEEVPSFQRHVIPVLSQLGCNGRSCHGSFQGQGDLRLSLFGYDFAADHAALTGGKEPRVDRKDPADSLILRKPTKTDPHKGGKRMDVGAWQYNLVSRWIAAGAVGHKETDVEFAALEVEPKELVFAAKGQTAKLKVIAKWDDGSREDVTPLARFRTNDETIATISDAGVVTAAGPGDTHVVAFYDNGVAAIPAILPVSDKHGPAYPNIPTPIKVDELIVAKLRKLGVVPADVCTDAEFLRRLSLDLTGTLPSAAEVTAFLADPSPDKRAFKIDQLLKRPQYAAWWATRLCDWTGASDRTGPLGGEQGLNKAKAGQWYHWLYRRLADNTPYDQIVEGIVLATARPQSGQTYEQFSADMSAYFRAKDPADFAARPTMPWFWTRRTLGNPDAKSLAFAHAFLGVNLQCAQCHKHPYDQWTKQDFDQFAAFFNGVRAGGGDRRKTQEMKQALGLGTLDEDSGGYKRKFVDLLAAGKTLPFKELTVPAPAKPAAKPAKAKAGPSGRVITPRLLGGEEVMANRYDDPRQPLMDWMRQPDNPYFARAFVNRVWAGYFNVGLIEPTDDLNLANPPSNKPLLNYLAEGFVQSGYDVRWIHRQITTSRAYQASWRPNDTNRLDERNFSRAVIRRLPAEVAYDAVVLATASDAERAKLDADPVNTRLIGVSSAHVSGRDPGGYAVTLFGKPPRAINCDCERSTEPSLLQTAYLRNDPDVLTLLDRKEGWIKQVASDKTLKNDDLVRQAYLRTLSRLPDENEMTVARGHLSAGDRTAALRDLMWALINTKEFVVNH
ncbi:MAG TPA: DUF1549 and DUF1553 domain-containing protein [Tepidisphaeraceae bacterium]|nr:DUF1549 and DUF1553 domain-containing protein [Tepidisphaeraceae bacterium]